MKNYFLLTLVAIFCYLSSGFNALPSKAIAADVAQTLCEYVASDDKKRLRKFLKSNKLKIRNVFKGIQCNGKDLLSFAASHNSVETGELMIKKLPKKEVKAIVGNLPAGPILDAANARIQ